MKPKPVGRAWTSGARLAVALGLLVPVAWTAIHAASLGKQLTVSVCENPTVTLTASPTTVQAGDSITLTWTWQADVTEIGGAGPAGAAPLFNPTMAAHSQTLVPPLGTHSFYLRGNGIRAVSAQVTVTPPPQPSLGASPTSLGSPGQSTTLTWSCQYCNGAVTSNFGTTSESGSQAKQVLNWGNNLFRMTATSAGGGRQVNADAWVNIPEPPPNEGDCFAAGTQVTLADGSTKNVEDLVAGDKVRSYDVNTGKFVETEVLETGKRARGDYLQINGGKGVTPDHLFFVNGEWKKAGDLKVGDELIDATGQPIKITSLVEQPGPVEVYPIRVADPPGTYIAQGVVVHNRDKSGGRNEGLLAGAMVTMADGSKKPIERVRAGDAVMAYFPGRRSFGALKVLAASKATASKYLVLNGKLKLAANNRMYQYVPGKKKPAR